MRSVGSSRMRWMWLSAILCAAVTIAAAYAVPQQRNTKQSEKDKRSSEPRGVEIVQHGGYPELRVDGSPFFIHSAAFFYYRIQRHEWARLLERYRSIGINTIEIYIPWNWHEPKEGELDFDGHTNPRRDLRGLLALIAQKKLKLIARPGPEILNEWRHGGYPDWLLQRPEYEMDSTDWLEGRYAPLDEVNAHDAEAAAQGWLVNATHMSYALKWLTAVATELAPYSSHRVVRSLAEEPDAPPRDASGPLLFVQLGDDFASGRNNRIGPAFRQYVDALRAAMEAGGLEASFINPTDMRVSAAGSRIEEPNGSPMGVMGQWYMRPLAPTETEGRLLDARDAGEIEFFAEELKTQPDFPPVMIEYQAGWYAPGDDDRPLESPPENTLLSSRLLIGNGVHGINYFPLQDTYTPVGYSVPWANQSYRWDAALDPNGEGQPRLQAVLRNSEMLEQWGPQLAAAHKRVDFGILYPLGAFPQDLLRAPDIRRVSESVIRLERLCALGMLSSELIDPEYQPVEQLLRDPMLLLPVFNSGQPRFQISEQAQRAVVEYVRRGGTLVVFPSKPAGRVLEEMWKSAAELLPPAPPTVDSAIRRRWKFGDGEVIESSKDFFSWLTLDRSLGENRAQHESEWATGVLREFLSAAGLQPAVRISGNLNSASELVANEIVTNDGTLLLGDRSTGSGFVSVTNLGDEQAEVSIEALSPSVSSKGQNGDYWPLQAVIPARESLLLPLGQLLCNGISIMTSTGTGTGAGRGAGTGAEPACSDAVTIASAEFLDARREGRTLELLFYVPLRAEIRLHLEQAPSHVMLEETKPEASWDNAAKELQVTIPRGAAPQFLRILKLELPYKPHVPEVEKAPKPARSDFDFFVANAVRLPAGENNSVRTYPPLVIMDSDQKGTVSIQGENHNKLVPRFADISIEGDLRGGGSLRISPSGVAIENVRVKAPQKEHGSISPEASGLLHSTIEVRSGKDDRSMPIAFLPMPAGATSNYRYDFDGDGAEEWVLENAGLRLIVSPESGGQAIALVDKATGANLASSVGLLRDSFSYTENATARSQLRPRGRWGFSNRAYTAEWQSEKSNPELRLHYDAADVYPAGASIEKTIQFDDSNTVRVEYRIALRPKEAGAGGVASPQSFVAVNSFPAVAADHPTQFCWPNATVANGSPDMTTTQKEESANKHCEDFARGGKSITVPEDEKHVEVRTPGRTGIAIEWECAESCPRMMIEPKNFSALFRLEFPALTPGAAPMEISVRFRILEPLPR
jgi:hypothetical protein